ncbi:MAG: methyltransferase domain-containing protein [Legionellales bacterium]|nr:methyltransferase domain-containing protein [Legionellales bacterium]
MQVLPKTLDELYAGEHIESLFPGGFINFGYYDGIDISSIDWEARIRSQENLYNQIISQIDLRADDSVLEVGIGYGGGPAWVARNNPLSKIVGIDIFEKHIKAAQRNFQHELETYPYLSYQQAVAENIPFADNTFNKIYTIEAFQHFVDQKKFIGEAFRTLKPGGKLGISSFFLNKPQSLAQAAELLPKIALVPRETEHQKDDKHESLITVGQLVEELEAADFYDICVKNIGSHVWLGYDKWVAKTLVPWNHGWLKAYEQGLLDYYIITVIKK